MCGPTTATPELAPFPLPRPRPPVILGVNSSVALAAIAGRRCDGINVRGDHARSSSWSPQPTRRGPLPAARIEPWDCSVWTMWDDGLLRADHPDRVRWASLGVTRLVLVFLVPFDPRRLEHVAIEP